MSLLQDVLRRNLLEGKNPPHFLPDNTHYLVRIGSDAYGCSNSDSDFDLYGWCIPPKEMLFPHLTGYVEGFGDRPQQFKVWQQHHIQDKDKGREYDFCIYNVAHYLHLCANSNPNMVDSLFVPQRCIHTCTRIGSLLREARKSFLSKECWPKFKAYAYSQLHKIDTKVPQEDSVRAQSVKLYGMDVKYAYHVVRLILECEQILVEGNLDLERNKEQLKSIRNGEWTYEEIASFCGNKEISLEEEYSKSSLPAMVDRELIRKLLLNIIEEHYGSLQKWGVCSQTSESLALRKIQTILDELNLQ